MNQIRKPIFLKDVAQNGAKINFTKLAKAVKQCEIDENNHKCKEMLKKEFGIELE